jgi:hypothetical protein
MNTETISRWLQFPAELPDDAAIRSLLQESPWFVPARLMEAAQHHRRRPFAPQSLTLIDLYSSDWLPAYYLLEAATRQSAPPPAGAIPEPEPAAERLDKQHHTSDSPAEAALIQPLYSEDYFRHQGIDIAGPEKDTPPPSVADDPKTLMVVMSFAEWLSHFKIKSEREQEEERDKRALRSMWQQEKLAAALEDEPDEIPEEVFEMAVSSITREDDLASESLAEILEKQGKWGAAAEMYRKLGLRNPAKSAYFASRAEAAKKRAS